MRFLIEFSVDVADEADACHLGRAVAAALRDGMTRPLIFTGLQPVCTCPPVNESTPRAWGASRGMTRPARCAGGPGEPPAAELYRGDDGLVCQLGSEYR